MDERILQAVAGEEAYVVGGAVRDELLGRPVVDLDVACPEPEPVARRYARSSRGALFPLSKRHGAWRVAFPDGSTVDFTPLRGGIEADLATRDFTMNAIAVPVAGVDPVDPFDGRGDLAARRLRAVSETVFADDPLRLLRAVRLEDELDFRLDPETERLVYDHAPLVLRAAGERILAELVRLSVAGYRRAGELCLLAPLGGSARGLDRAGLLETPDFLLLCVLGESVFRLPISNGTRRFARTLLSASPPLDASPRAIHRFRRATEPWAVEALVYLGAGEYAAPVRDQRAHDPAAPLLRGDELGLPPGPEIGRLLERIAEERAAGTISTRDEALELVRREQSVENAAHSPRGWYVPSLRSGRLSMSHDDAVQARFAATAARMAALGERRMEATRERVRSFVEPAGTERALDVGTGTGTLAFALAPLVREVVGLDLVPEMLAEARRGAASFGNVSFVEGDCLALPFEPASFDLTATARTVHHLSRPELAVAEMTRVTRPGGRLLVVDQIASVDPLEALAHNRIERLRDPSHVRVLSDQDFRALFEANWLRLLRFELEHEERDLGGFLDLAGCEGEARQAVIGEVEKLLARGERAGVELRRAGEGYALTLRVAWYLLDRLPTPTTAT